MTVYIFDTNSFSKIIMNYYESCFPSFWTAFDSMIKNNQIISVKEVYLEMNYPKKLNDWAKENKEIFKIADNIEAEFVKEIFKNKHFRNHLIKPSMSKDYKIIADPFIIAKAYNLKGCIVTELGFLSSSVTIQPFKL